MKYSIIIPVFNAERYVRACLDSVLAQTNRDWECICINDGSSDGSLTILDSYRDRDSRIKVISQLNGGPSRARNVGLSRAEGDWVTFLDADDFVQNDYLANFDRLVAADVAADIYAGKCVIVDGQGAVLGPERQLPTLPLRSVSGCVLDAVSKDKYRWCLQASCAKIVKRDLLVRWGIKFNEHSKMWEDSLFWSECFAFSGKLVVDFSFGGYFYRQVEGSLSRIQKPTEFHREIAAVKECSSIGVEFNNAQLKKYSARIALSLISLIRVRTFFGDKREYVKGLVYHEEFKKAIVLPILCWGEPFYYRIFSFALMIMPRCIIDLVLRCLITK